MREIILSAETIQKIDQIKDYVSGEFGSKKGSDAKKFIKSRILSLKSFPYQGESLSEMFGFDTNYRRLYVPPIILSIMSLMKRLKLLTFIIAEKII